jgi:hypothetical protein
MHLLVVQPESGRTLGLPPHVDRAGWIIADPHHRDPWAAAEGINAGSQGLEHRARHQPTIENLRHQSLDPEEELVLAPELDLLALSPELDLLALSPELDVLALSPELELPLSPGLELPLSPVELPPLLRP